MAGEGKGKRAPGVDRAEAAGWPAWVVSEVAHGNLVEREWKGVSVLVGTLPLCRIEPNDGQIDGLPSNPREWTQEEFNDLRQSIIDTPELFVGRGCLVVPWGGDSAVTLGGNMRYFVSADLEEERVPAVLYHPDTSIEKMKEIVMKDNGSFGRFNWDKLANEWDGYAKPAWGIRVWDPADGGAEAPAGSGSGNGTAGNSKPATTSLAERFVVPPFSILDTRKGYWQARKKVWRELIGDNGESRNDTLFTSLEVKYKDLYLTTRKHREELGLSFKEYLDKYVSEEVKEREAAKVTAQGVSLLDPVMAELVCRWFGVDGVNKAFDPFAGDSVFGYVAAHLGNDFTGIELRQEQADLNAERTAGMTARYICDDGQNVAAHLPAGSQDLLFSCPPYFDLERYSDLPNDASNQKDYGDFLAIIRNAFTAAVGCLKENRFAVIVVGDIRDKATGCYMGFVDDVKGIFRDAGMQLYNEIILIETGASTAMRAARYMESRKVAKMHQTILVFYKGDPRAIKEHFSKIEYASEDLELFRVDSGNESGDDPEEV